MCQRLQWRLRVTSRSTFCAKNEPPPCNAHLCGKLGIFAPGGFAAAGSLTVVYPPDYARKRLVSDVGSGKKIFDGLLGCLKKTASGPKGFFSFYAGLGVSLGGIIPYRGFQFAALDTIMGLYPWKNDTGMMGFFFFTSAAAQIAILVGAGISYPFDIVRGRLQMQAERPAEQHIHKGTVERLKKIVAEVGIVAGVYNGFVANALRSVGGAGCRCFVIESRITWAWAAWVVASEAFCPDHLVCLFQPDAPTVRSV